MAIINGKYSYAEGPILGTEGDDYISPESGNSTIIGGAGNDTFNEGSFYLGMEPTLWIPVQELDGDDTYVFGPGWGQDKLYRAGAIGQASNNPNAHDNNTILFQSGISPSDLTVSLISVDSTTIKISTADGANSLEVGLNVGTGYKSYFGTIGVRFADGTSWSESQLWSLANQTQIYMGTSGNDTLSGVGHVATGDTLLGMGGDDVLRSGEGKDVIRGGLGNDLIELKGTGDTVFFDLGDGRDTIVGAPASPDYATINFGPGISLRDITIRARDASWLGSPTRGAVVLDLGQGDQITLYNAGVGLSFSSAAADNLTEWQFSSLVDNRQIAGTPQDDRLMGFSDAETMRGGAGNDTLFGGEGSDFLVGGDGNDVLYGGLHLDTIEGGAGDDLLIASPLDVPIDLRGTPVSSKQDYSDVFLFAPGFGHDTIVESDQEVDSSNYDRDVVVFTEGISSQDVLVHKTDDRHLLLSTNGGKDTLLFNTKPLVDGSTSEAGIREVRFADGTVWNTDTLQATADIGPPAFLDLKGTDANDQLSGGTGNDLIDGRSGHDQIEGGAGDDTLTGGAGQDTLTGDAGADTYLFAAGDGQDLIHADALDVIVLQGSALVRSGLTVGKLGAKVPGTVELGFKGLTDTITLDQAGQWDGLTLRFSDQGSMTGAELMALATRPDVPVGKALTGTAGRDNLLGGAGNDTLSGLVGADTLTGGQGNDLLNGGKGNDTYRFARGDGQDTLVERDSTWFNSDTLVIGQATRDQIWLTKTGNNLDISIVGTTDKVSIDGWFSASANRVESITVDGGKSLAAGKVSALVNAMAAFQPPAVGATSMAPEVQAKLSKLLASSWR
jgi:Ca2+-binding RTX toxin-like protein